MRALFLGLYIVILVSSAQSNAEMVWVDANGRTISPFAGGAPSIGCSPSGCGLAYVAPDGLIWAMNAETATVSPQTRAFIEDIVFFADPECAGPAYVTVVPPRYVYTIRDTSCAWVRPDNLAGEVITVTYRLVDSVCARFGGGGYLMPISELIEVDPTPPDLGACPPLHLERR